MDAAMRKLKLDEPTIRTILGRLEEEDRAVTSRSDLQERFEYRVRSLQVDVQESRDVTVSYIAAARNIGRDGINFLIGNVVHIGSPCVLHLITIRNNWQTVSGKVVGCRYIQGSARVYEANIRFDRPIDPASFAPTAVRARVLVADDSMMARRLISHLLEALNCEVSFAEDGIAAVKSAQENAFDLILMDLEMPKLDGISATRILRSKGYVRSIVAVTSFTEDEVREKALVAGCDDFLPKPVRHDTLELVINRTKPEPLVSALLHREDMQPLIDEFVRDLPDRVRRMEAAFAGEDNEALLVEVRKLKGEGAGFGFEPITNAACNVEVAAKHQQSTGELRARMSDLVRLCMAARPATWDNPALEDADADEQDEGGTEEGGEASGEETVDRDAAETAKEPAAAN